jgi:putative transposase
MPDYIRAYIPGATCFFTVALLERRRRLLTEHIDALRESFLSVRMKYPFKINAIVILPDHLHCIWTLAPKRKGHPYFLRRKGHAQRGHGALRYHAAVL